MCADARATGLPSGSFDLVHARTLLINVPQPESVLAEMVRLARPGGWVTGAEPDGEYSLCCPPHPAFDRLHELFITAFARHGADPRIGRRLAELYRHAGLEQVTVEVRADLYPLGHTRRTIQADLVQAMRSQIVALGLASERELEHLDRTVRAHLGNPATIVMGHLFFVASARKPPKG